MQRTIHKTACFILFAALIAGAQSSFAQQSILGSNLVVNGNAESGSAGASITDVVASIPAWTRVGNVTVLPYGVTSFLQLTSPAPQDRAFQYFVGAGYPPPGTLTQDIDVSAGASLIDAGNIKFTASAFLGAVTSSRGDSGSAEADFAFKNANGQTFSTASLGPLGYPGTGVSLQQQIGLVPAGTVRITVTVSFHGLNGGYAAADSISLVLTQLSTSPSSILGTNLVVNGGAEVGPNALPGTVAPYVPGWSTTGVASVAPYGGAGWIAPTDPGPVDRGVSLFGGGGGGPTYSQDLDVSAAASLIDAGQGIFELSAWFGALPSPHSSVDANITYTFFDWSGKQLASTAQLLSQTGPSDGLYLTTQSGTLPAGTRRVHILMTLPTATSLADNVAFVLGGPGGPPVIAPGGIVSLGAFGGFTAISPGSWLEIYGVNLAASTKTWTDSDFSGGVAPTTLGGVTVSIGGKAAFVEYVSPGQIDVLVPSDLPVGTAELTITNLIGTSLSYGLYVNPTEPGLLAPPAFLINGNQYVVALFTDGVTFALPTGALPNVQSHPAKAGDTLILYGVGFGPVSGGFTAGTLVTAQNTLATPFKLFFGNTPASLSYYGLAPSFTGLYQFNVVVPSIPANALERLSFTLDNASGSQTLYIATE